MLKEFVESNEAWQYHDMQTNQVQTCMVHNILAVDNIHNTFHQIFFLDALYVFFLNVVVVVVVVVVLLVVVVSVVDVDLLVLFPMMRSCCCCCCFVGGGTGVDWRKEVDESGV